MHAHQEEHARDVKVLPRVDQRPGLTCSATKDIYNIAQKVKRVSLDAILVHGEGGEEAYPGIRRRVAGAP